MTTPSATHWSGAKKFTFLCIALYTFFYIFPFPFDAFPQLDFIFRYYYKLSDSFVLWTGKNILHITELKKNYFSDSGDTTFDYAKIFIFLILSILLALTILIIDRKRSNYEKLNAWLFIYIRYCIGFYMLVYGFDKVFKSHFPFPSLEKLDQTFGESTPQGLLWAFMGYSTTYTVYLGIMEVLSGFLLFFKRTMAIGTILILIIMINVCIINFSYDVPVKLFALHMVGYTFLLLAPFLRPVFQFFILQKPTELPIQLSPVFPEWISDYRKLIKSLVITSFTLLFMNFSVTNMQTDGDSVPKPPLYGIYSTSLFCINNDTLPALQSDPVRWKKIIFDTKKTIIVSGNLSGYYSSTVDTIKKAIIFRSNKDTTHTFQLSYSTVPGYLALNGIINNDTLEIHFKKTDLNNSPLINNRGVNWIREYPYNN